MEVEPSQRGPEPTIREFIFRVQVVNDHVEVLSLIEQIFYSYPRADRTAVAAWLWAREGHVYGVTIPPRPSEGA